MTRRPRPWIPLSHSCIPRDSLGILPLHQEWELKIKSPEPSFFRDSCYAKTSWFLCRHQECGRRKSRNVQHALNDVRGRGMEAGEIGHARHVQHTLVSWWQKWRWSAQNVRSCIIFRTRKCTARKSTRRNTWTESLFLTAHPPSVL